MKKLFFILLLMPLISMAQQNVFTVTPNNGRVVWNFDVSTMSGTDTTFPFKIRDNGTGKSPAGWSAQAQWIDLDTTGIIVLKVTNFEMTNWEVYYDSLSIAIPDSTGHDGIEDAMWNWRYGQLGIELDDTCLNGNIWIWMNVKYE